MQISGWYIIASVVMIIALIVAVILLEMRIEKGLSERNERFDINKLCARDRWRYENGGID